VRKKALQDFRVRHSKHPKGLIPLNQSKRAGTARGKIQRMPTMKLEALVYPINQYKPDFTGTIRLEVAKSDMYGPLF
jgi:hypothetical protein